MRIRCVRLLTAEETAALKTLHREGKSHLERCRAQFLLFSAQGKALCEAAQLAGISRKTAGYTLRRFESQGVAILREHVRTGRRSALTPELAAELATVLAGSPRAQQLPTNNWTGPVLVQYLQKKHALTLSDDQARRWLQRLGFRRVRPRPRLAKGDPEAKS